MFRFSIPRSWQAFIKTEKLLFPDPFPPGTHDRKCQRCPLAELAAWGPGPGTSLMIKPALFLPMGSKWGAEEDKQSEGKKQRRLLWFLLFQAPLKPRPQIPTWKFTTQLEDTSQQWAATAGGSPCSGRDVAVPRANCSSFGKAASKAPLGLTR